jgi:glycosyltransferase involved in cell wall biosynthesis
MTDALIHLWSPGFTRFGGGITAFSRELALALRDGGTKAALFGKDDRTGVWEALPVRGSGGLPEAIRTPAFALCLLAGAWQDRPHAIVSTHLNFGSVAHLAKRWWRIPYILVAHGIDVHPELSAARLAALRSADQVIAVSAWTRHRVLALGGILADRVSVLPDTYDDQQFVVAKRSPSLAARYQLHANEKVILTVARLNAVEGYKGYDRILQALPEIISACGRVRFLIVGKGDDRIRLEVMARELGITDAVTFAGFITDDELADHYRLADVFAMPSTGEGFGIVFLEAMGCGTPVLGGNQDGSVDALDGGRLGLLVDPTSVAAIAAGLISLLRQKGPDLWFDRGALSSAVQSTYGRESFQRRVALLFH